MGQFAVASERTWTRTNMIDLKSSEALVQLDRQIYAQFCRIPYLPLTVARTLGTMVEDLDGNQYIDCFAGSCTANIGFNHPDVIAALHQQITRFVSYPLPYAYNEPYLDLAKKVIEMTPGDFDKKVYFGLSGSDANDLVIKLARAYTGKNKVIAYRGGYYGSYWGSGSMSAVIPTLRTKFGPMLSDIEHIHYPNCYRCPFSKRPESCRLECFSDFLASLDTHIDATDIAAIVIEPILGDGGLYPPPKKYMQALARFCREHQILLVSDEVQQGLGRAGKWCAIEHYDVVPDMVVFGKSLGGGLPMSAVIARSEIMDAMSNPSHGTSLSAHALGAAAGLATIAVMERENVLERSLAMGEIARARFAAMQARFEFIGDVRGIGFNLGIDIVKDRETREGDREAAAKICFRCFEKGLIFVFLGASVMRFQPSLLMTEQELEHVLTIIEAVFEEFAGGLIGNEALTRVQGW